MSGDLGDLIAEMRKEYLDGFDEKYALLNKLYNDKDQKGLENEFHKLKGTGTTYGAPEISQLCGHLEKLCAAGFPNPTQHALALELLEKIRGKYLRNESFDLESASQFKELLS